MAAAFWPRAKIVAALRNRYRTLDDLGAEDGFGLYGITEGDVRFVVALILVDGSEDKVAEIGFLSRFSGFALSNAQLGAMNRNLHISVATFHSDGDLYLIGGVAAAGEFNSGAFLLILEAWKRDLLVVLHAISVSSSFVDAFPALRSAKVQQFATNRAKEPAGALFQSFAGSARLSAVCQDCGGRGRTGLIARRCAPCDGSGFVSNRRD
ncbi:MAG: hypothetical protein ACKVS5_06220 [Parvularculaceae bacterium]